MAHRAVNPHLAATPRIDRRRPQRPRAWMFALGSAAGVVLAAGVAWQLRSSIEAGRNEGLLSSPPPAAQGVIAVQPLSSPGPPADAAAPPVAPSPAAPAPSMPAAMPAPPPPALLPQKAAAPPAPGGGELAKAKQDVQEVLAEPQAEQAAPARRRDEVGVTEYTTSAGSAGPAPKPAPNPFPSGAARAAKTAPAATAPAAASPRDLEAVVVGGSRVRAPDPAQPASGRTADSVERKAELATGGDHAFLEAPDRDAAAASAAAGARLREVPANPSPRSSAVLQNNARLAPQDWIALMQQLLRDDERDQARENLELFRRKYPDYVLPPDLKALLERP
jgi:hypothetical protein